MKNLYLYQVKKIILLFLLFLCSAGPAFSQTEGRDVSTKYFGPNAFPVPDMIKCTAGKLEIEVGTSGALGHLTACPDKTVDIDYSIKVPLWTDRVNFRLWGQAYEWYWDNPQTRSARHVSPDEPLSGGLLGEIYFSVDMLVLREKKYQPAITLRAACKTAFGGQFNRARYYDTPGYFFDLCISKDFHITQDVALSASASAGFLCWQVMTSGNQDEGAMYGAAIGIKSKPVNFSADYGGYVGWRNNGDHPMTLKLRADIIPDYFVSPFLAYQHGFVDWPFDQLQLGVRFSVGILKQK